MHASSSHGAELTDRCDTSSSELHESVLDLQQYRALLNQQQAVRPAIRFSNLASIEVQSIMHFLDAGSIITLVLYSDADTGFAWKHLTPDCLCECEEFPLSSMGLQHCVLDLTEMDGCEPSSSIWDTQLYHQLTGLMISESTSRPFTRYLLQQHKFLASVRTLTLDLNHTSSRAFFKIVVGCVRLPSLTSVDVKNHSDWDQLNVRKACIKLHPNIGTLELHQMSASSKNVWLTATPLLPRLHHLRLLVISGSSFNVQPILRISSDAGSNTLEVMRAFQHLESVVQVDMRM